MDTVPDPPLTKSGGYENRTQDLWICSQEHLPPNHRGNDVQLHKFISTKVRWDGSGDSHGGPFLPDMNFTPIATMLLADVYCKHDGKFSSPIYDVLDAICLWCTPFYTGLKLCTEETLATNVLPLHSVGLSSGYKCGSLLQH
jgi:hypothetical protein